MRRFYRSVVLVPLLILATGFSLAHSVRANGSTLPAVGLVLWHQQGETTIQQLGILRIFDAWASANAPGATLTLVQKDSDDLSTHFMSLPPGMIAPDLLWTTADLVVPALNKGLIQPVDSVVEMNRFLPMLIDSIRIKGKLYGVPIQAGNFLMLFYNKKFAKQAPQTFIALQTLASDLMANNANDTHFTAFAYNESDPYWAFPIANAFGATLLSQDNKFPTLNSDAWVKTYQFVHDLKFKTQVLPENCDYECADSGFRSGETAIIINGDWALQGDQNYTDVLGNNLGIAPLPAIGNDPNNQRPIPSVIGQYILLPTTTTGDKLITAEAFLKFLATDKSTVLSWTVPNRRLPALLDALNSDVVANDPILTQTSKIMMTGVALPMRPETQCVLKALAIPFNNLMNDGILPADLAKQTQQKATDCISKQP